MLIICFFFRWHKTHIHILRKIAEAIITYTTDSITILHKLCQFVCLISIRGVFFYSHFVCSNRFVLFCSLLISFSNLILNLFLIFRSSNYHIMFLWRKHTKFSMFIFVCYWTKKWIQRIAINPIRLAQVPSAILIFWHFVFISFDTQKTFSHSILFSWLFVYTHTQTRYISIFLHWFFIKHIQFQRVSLCSVTENVNICFVLVLQNFRLWFTVTNTLIQSLSLSFSLSLSHTHKHQSQTCIQKKNKSTHLPLNFYWNKKLKFINLNRTTTKNQYKYN